MKYIDDLIAKVLETHPDFGFNELREVCDNFLNSLPKKCKKETTKHKLLNKYLIKEFELDWVCSKPSAEKKYSLDNIPKYLYDWHFWWSYDLLDIRLISKFLWKTHLFDSVSTKISCNDKIALIWKNWSWKTTLLKMIVWLEDPDDWEINLWKNVKIWYLTQELFWNNKENSLRDEMLTVFPEITKDTKRLEQIEDMLLSEWNADYVELNDEREEIVERFSHSDWYRRFELQTSILFYFWFTEQQLDLNVLQLSGWEQTKVQIAKFLIQEIDLLVLDEPTNHLDIEWIMFLERFCKFWNKWLLCISHDVKFINSISNEILEISWKKLHLYKWDYFHYLEKKQEKYDKQLKDHSLQQRHIEKQEKYIDRFRSKASKALWVQSRIKMLDKIERIDRPENESQVRDISLKSINRMPNLIVRLNDLQIWYDNVLINITWELEINKNQKVWIIGKNWIWKTTFLRTILWEIKSLSWDVYINESINVWSYSQVFDDINVDRTILEELLDDWLSQKEIRTMLWWLLISWEKVNQKISTLSGWEKAKVALTKMLLSGPQLIIMDEPTNHLDLHSKKVVKNMLDWFEWNVILVSHDRDILESIVDRVWVIKDGGIRDFSDLDKGFDEIYGG